MSSSSRVGWNRIRWFLLIAGVLLSGMAWTGPRVNAQGLPGGDAGFNAAVAQLLGEVPAFSATVETSLTNRADRSWLTVPMQLMKRENRFRLEVDLASIKGASEIIAQVTAVQRLGLAKMSSLVLPEEKGMVLLFPGLKAWTRVSLAETEFSGSGYKLTKRRSGREKVNGYECVRQRVRLTGSGGEKLEATIWEAPELGNFPVRMQFEPEDSVVTMDFQKINRSAPDASMFQPPSDYRQFEGMSGLMQEALGRLSGGR